MWSRLAVGVCVVVAASGHVAEAQFVPHALAPQSTYRYGCLGATPEGSVIAWQVRGRAYVGGLDGAGRPARIAALPREVGCPVPAIDATGAAAVAGTTADGERLVIGRRSADGRFPAFAPAGPAGEERHVESVAVGGGLVAVGFGDERLGGAVLLQRADGTVVGPVRLPGRPSGLETEGPRVGLDAAGRGLVVWIDAPFEVDEEHPERLMAATLAPDGTLGPVRVLAANVAIRSVSLAVGPDGRAAAAWREIEGRTVVVTGDTASGLDVATATETAIAHLVAIQPDGAAVAAESSLTSESVLIASRAAGRPFTRPHRLHGRSASAVAIDRGVATAVADVGDGRLEDLVVLSGRAGDTLQPRGSLPTASAIAVDLVVSLPGGAPAVLAQLGRREHVTFGDPADVRYELATFGPGTARRPNARVRIARVQRIGRSGNLRLRVRCDRPCAIRVASPPRRRGRLADAARRLPGGRTVLVRVPYGRPVETTPPADPPRVPRVERVRLAIGITDAQGELRLRRTVTVRRDLHSFGA